MWVEPDENKNQFNNPNPTQPVVGAGGGGAQVGGTTGNPSTITPVQTNQPQQQFATVQDYLGANKQQGEDLGQKFTSSLSDTATNERGAIDTAANQAKSDISAGTTNYDTGIANTALTNPTAITNSPDQLQNYLKQWNASYTGPTSFEASTSYTPAASAANEATTKAGELGTTGGQQQLLQDQFNVYGQGNKGLDQAILQNSTYYPKVQSQATEFSSIPDYLAKTATDINTNAVPAAQQTSTATQNQFRSDIAQGLTAAQQKEEASKAAAGTTARASGPGGSFLSSLPANPTDLDLAQFGMAHGSGPMSRAEYNALVKTYYPNFVPTNTISNPVFSATSNNNYPQDLTNYLALKQLANQ